MKTIKISEYLNNKKINCSTFLIKENWERLLNSDERIFKYIEEWKNKNIDIKINSITHLDSDVRSPDENGWKNFFYDKNIKKYISYEMTLTRNSSTHERKKYGRLCKEISINIDLPLNMWLTVLRADIQHRLNNKIKNYD